MSSLFSSFDDDNDENCLDRSNIEILNSQKSLIYKHPLFPVLAHVLEQCEKATVNPSFLTTNDDHPILFEDNLKHFLTKNNYILTMTRDRNDLSSIIDEFYIDAMQVLRIHLLELEKLDDLCKDFCQRYINCLKVKLNPNNIFTDDEDDVDEDFEVNHDEGFDLTTDTEEELMFNQQQWTNKYVSKVHSHSSLPNEQTISMNDINPTSKTKFDGQTALSQIISSGSTSFIDSSSPSFLFDIVSTKQRKEPSIISSSKRTVLPKSATSIMRSWLFQHITHPYPNEDEKRVISAKTNLSLLQVNNWFINARRRILQPMFETSNPALLTTKKRKRHDTTLDSNYHDESSRPTPYMSRYWSSNLTHFDEDKK